MWQMFLACHSNPVSIFLLTGRERDGIFGKQITNKTYFQYFDKFFTLIMLDDLYLSFFSGVHKKELEDLKVFEVNCALNNKKPLLHNQLQITLINYKQELTATKE